MKIGKRNSIIAIVALAFGLTVAIPLWAQRNQVRPFAQANRAQRDPLAILRQALNKAGANALSSAQEQQLNSLVSSFREARKNRTPDQSVQTATANYQAAVLTGDPAKAVAAADQLAVALSGRTTETLEANARFLAQVYSVLQNDQVAALETSIGKTGLFRVLRSLIGPMGLGRGALGAASF
jgi:hypothetical protein